MRACRNLVSGDFCVFERNPAPTRLRRVETQYLFDRVGNQRRISKKRFPLLPVAQEADEAIAEEIGDDLVPGKRETLHNGFDFFM